MRLLHSLLALLAVAAVTVAAKRQADDDAEKPTPKYTVTEEVWFEVEVKDMDGPGEDFTGRFTIAAMGEDAPATVMNFVSLAKGWKSPRGDILQYKNTPIHRVVPDFVVQMGDVTAKDGTGGASIYGKAFNDEAFILSHRGAGWVAMANHGPDTNGSQFYILLTKARWLDRHHVVFGKVIRGFDVVNAIGELPTNPNNAVPKKRVRIVDCGIVGIKRPYQLSKADMDSVADLPSKSEE